MTIGSLYHLVYTFQLQIVLVLKRVHIFLITSQIVFGKIKTAARRIDFYDSKN